MHIYMHTCIYDMSARCRWYAWRERQSWSGHEEERKRGCARRRCTRERETPDHCGWCGTAGGADAWLAGAGGTHGGRGRVGAHTRTHGRENARGEGTRHARGCPPGHSLPPPSPSAPPAGSVCVCVTERDIERARERKRDREREGESARARERQREKERKRESAREREGERAGREDA